MSAAESHLSQTIVVQGITKDGKKFRPSDWAERMSGMLSTFGDDHRIHYSPQLKPVSMKGVKCIAIDPELRESNPAAFNQIMDFANRNELKVIETTNDELERNLD